MASAYDDEVASQAGVSPKTIRYYESVGLIPAAARRENGYRHYRAADLRTLRFIHRASVLGFSVAEVEERSRSGATSAAAQAIATAEGRRDRTQDCGTRGDEVRAIHHLAANCHGDSRPASPILDDLTGECA